MRLTASQKKQLAVLLKREHALAGAFLFGSQAKGTAGLLSDVDVAVVFRSSVPVKKRARVTRDLFIKAARMLGTDHIDLFDAAAVSSVLLRYNALVHGTLLFAADASAVHAARFRAVQDYEDFRPHLVTQERLIKRKVAAYGSR